MATEVIKIIDPDNGTGTDYTSLSAWEAAMQKNLVTADEISVAKCRCTGGTADTTAVLVYGWTTDATRYIKIWTDPAEGYRHDGKWNTSKYRLSLSNSDALTIYATNYVIIDGLQISSTCTSLNYAAGIRTHLVATTGVHIIKNCLLDGGHNGYNASWGIYYAGQDAGSSLVVNIYNNIIYGYDASGMVCVGIHNDGASTINAYSNTISGGYRNYLNASTGVFNLKNNISVNQLSSGYYGTFNTTATNLSEDASSPDGASYRSQAPTFVDEAAFDFHLASNDTIAINRGTDTSGESAPLNFTTDIDGETRSSWDIGADEYVAAAATGNPWYYFAQLQE
jgi:hypothetical protein